MNEQNYKFDFCVVMGRFEPFHLGHKAIIDNALTISNKVIILLGSQNKPRTIKNPFTVTERILMMSSVYKNSPDIIFSGLNDYLYDDNKWALETKEIIKNIILSENKNPDECKIAISGNKADVSSWYIDMFPEFDYIFPEHIPCTIHSTQIRDSLFKDDIKISYKNIQKYVPSEVLLYIESFKKTSDFYNLVNEYAYIDKYKKSWEKAPYAPTFVTVDIFLIQSDNVLLIQRKDCPGKNLYALPGGFLNQNELIIDGAIRELHEETKLQVPITVLKRNIKEIRVFDAIDRSLRGRTITHVVYIELPNGDLPIVEGLDDAIRAFFMPLNLLRSKDFFEDHFEIIQSLLEL